MEDGRKGLYYINQYPFSIKISTWEWNLLNFSVFQLPNHSLMRCFSHGHLISPGWGCSRELWSIRLGVGVLAELISLILSESYRLPSLYSVILDNLCNLWCFIVLTCYMGRIALILLHKVSLRIKWENVSESTLESVKCYLKEWKEIFLFLQLVA